MPRPAIPKTLETELLLRSQRRCAVCFGIHNDSSVKEGQIAHLDRNSSNHSLDNLAFLCLSHHNMYDSRSRQAKGLTKAEVKRYRHQLYVFLETMRDTNRTPGLRPRFATSHSGGPFQELLQHALDCLLRDRFEDGHVRGGWGKDYRDRYFTDLFPDDVPSDALVHPHSISFTLWVVEGLTAFNEYAVEHGLNNEMNRGLLDTVFEEVSDYYRRHFDKQTGGVGPCWSGTDAEPQVAPNVRHASSGLVAFLELPGCGAEIQQTASYILTALDNGNLFEESRAISIAAILRALYAIVENPLLAKGIASDTSKIRRQLAIGEVELLTRYEMATGIWDSGRQGSDTARIWYSIWVLRSLPQLQRSKNEEMRVAYRRCLERLVHHDLVETENGHGLPYKPNGTPDIGATASLLAVLRRDEMLHEGTRDQVAQSLLRFLVHEHRNPAVLENTYSWTWAMVLLAVAG